MGSKIYLNCYVCGKSIWRYTSCKAQRSYCSKDCRVGDYKTRFTGSRNPNFNKRWSQTSKDKLATTRKKNGLSQESRYKMGATNRGKKLIFSAEQIEKMRVARMEINYTHSEDTKKIIGEKSSQKFTPEFRAAFRLTMEQRGCWVPIEDKTALELYYKESDWIQNMVKYFSPDEKKLFDSIGLFNKTNSKGCVRDHIVSRRIGFELNIPFELIRHPANLSVITHSDNITKGFVDSKQTKKQKYVSVLDLIERIELFQGDWDEHERCLEIINGKV